VPTENSPPSGVALISASLAFPVPLVLSPRSRLAREEASDREARNTLSEASAARLAYSASVEHEEPEAAKFCARA
jgi:hypothetical protein